LFFSFLDLTLSQKIVVLVLSYDNLYSVFCTLIRNVLRLKIQGMYLSVSVYYFSHVLGNNQSTIVDNSVIQDFSRIYRRFFPIVIKLKPVSRPSFFPSQLSVLFQALGGNQCTIVDYSVKECFSRIYRGFFPLVIKPEQISANLVF